MYCRKCGSQLEAGAAFCMVCGTKVEGDYRNRGLRVEDFDDGEATTVDGRVRPQMGKDEFQTDIMTPDMMQPARERRPQPPHIQMGVPGAGVPYGNTAEQSFGETERLSQEDMPESIRKSLAGEPAPSDKTVSGRNPLLKGKKEEKKSQDRDVVGKMNKNVQTMVQPKKKPVNKKKLAIILSIIAAVLLITGGLLFWFLVIRADKKFDDEFVNQQIYSDMQLKSYGASGSNDSYVVSYDFSGDGIPGLRVSGKQTKTISLPGEITKIHSTGGIAIVDGCAYTRLVCVDDGGTEAVVIKADIKKGKSEILYRTGLSGSIDLTGCRFLSLFYAKPDGFYVLEQAGENYSLQKVDWFGKKSGKPKATVGNAFIPGIKGDKLLAADETNSNVVSVALKNGSTENLFSLSALPEEFGRLATLYQASAGKYYAFNEEGVLYVIEGSTAPSVNRMISMKELSYSSADEKLKLYADPVLVNDQKNYYLPFFYEESTGKQQVGLIMLDAERGNLGGEVLFTEKGVTGIQVKGDTLRIDCSESGYQKENIAERLSGDTFATARGNMESDLMDYCSGKITRNDLDSSTGGLKAADQAGYCYVTEAADLLQESVDYYNKEGYLGAKKSALEAMNIGAERNNIYTEKCGKLIVAACLDKGLRHYQEMAEEAYENNDMERFGACISTLEALYEGDEATLASIAEFAAKYDFTLGTRAEDHEAYMTFISEKIINRSGTQVQDKEVIYIEADGIHVVHCQALAVADFDKDGHDEMFMYTARETVDGSEPPCGEAAIYDIQDGVVTKTVYGRSTRMTPVRLDFFGDGNIRVSGFSENDYADMYIGVTPEKAAALSCTEGQVYCVNHVRGEDKYNQWRESETGQTEVSQLNGAEFSELEQQLKAGGEQDVELIPFNQSGLEKALGE